MTSRDPSARTPAGVLAGAEPFVEVLSRSIAAARRDDEPVCVAVLGVHGEAGDAQLTPIGAALSRSIRGGDVVARLDGPRFGLVLHRCELDILDIVARRLAAQVPSPLAGSLGIAYFSDPPPGDDREAADHILSTAAAALSEALAGDHARVVVRTR